MATRDEFNKVIQKWYMSSYEHLVSCLEKAEAMLPNLPAEDKTYAEGIIKMIRDTKIQCDDIRARVKARHKK